MHKMFLHACPPQCSPQGSSSTTLLSQGLFFHNFFLRICSASKECVTTCLSPRSLSQKVFPPQVFPQGLSQCLLPRLLLHNSSFTGPYTHHNCSPRNAPRQGFSSTTPLSQGPLFHKGFVEGIWQGKSSGGKMLLAACTSMTPAWIKALSTIPSSEGPFLDKMFPPQLFPHNAPEQNGLKNLHLTNVHLHSWPLGPSSGQRPFRPSPQTSSLPIVASQPMIHTKWPQEPSPQERGLHLQWPQWPSLHFTWNGLTGLQLQGLPFTSRGLTGLHLQQLHGPSPHFTCSGLGPGLTGLHLQ